METIAEHLDHSSSTLGRRSKAVMGRTLKEEIRRTQLGRARDLLARTNLPIPVVAAQSGYSSARSFSEVIHHWAGETPQEHRHRFQSPVGRRKT